MSSNHNPIVKREYYAIDIELASPINVFNGNSIETDSDVLVNGNGEVFIPGTSIAGALRGAVDRDKKYRYFGGSYKEKEAEDKDEIDEVGIMSKLFISDLFLTENVHIVKRDGVQLLNDKTVGNKFDMQAVETGAKGIMYINYVERENDELVNIKRTIDELILGINNGDIRFGANKNRGFGRLKINDVHTKSFDKNNASEYTIFDVKDVKMYNEGSYTEWSSDKNNNSKYVTIDVPLKLTGGISIRKYSTRPNEADYEQLTITKRDDKGNKIPVVPGTSWNGAIRSDMLEILTTLMGSETKAKDTITRWFGYIKDNKPKGVKDDALQSLVVISESQINDSIPMNITRNKINRFDASTISGALYQDRAYFGGTTHLTIKVRKEYDRSYEACIGALLVVIKDIQKGFQNIGGLGAVGRGVFESNGDVKIFGGSEKISEESEKEYLRALATYVKEVNQK